MQKTAKSPYHGHRFPVVVISQALRWYFRFQLSLRDFQERLFERGMVVSHETIRRWCEQFGASFAHRVKAGIDTWHLDEMFVTLRGEPSLRWRAVDRLGAELDILVQKRRDKTAAKRQFRRVLAVVQRRHARSSRTSCATIRPRRSRSRRLRTSGACS